MRMSTTLPTSSSASTAARASTPSASRRELLTSTILKLSGAGGSAGRGGADGPSMVTTARSSSADRFARAFSSGTMCAPVPLVSVSRIHVFAINLNLATPEVAPSGALAGRWGITVETGRAHERADVMPVGGDDRAAAVEEFAGEQEGVPRRNGAWVDDPQRAAQTFAEALGVDHSREPTRHAGGWDQ